MKLTVITACLPSRADFLSESAGSVPNIISTRSGNWDVEWVLALDGPGSIPELSCQAPMKVLQSTQPEGVSSTRNRALMAAAGSWIVNLDGDDTLLADGLSVVAEALESSPDYGWAAGVLLDSDGTIYPSLSSASDKRWRKGELVDEWTVPMAFHPGVSWMRRDLLIASGGCPALSFVEDKLPIFLVSELAPGITVPNATHQYRRHDEQTSASLAHKSGRQHGIDFTCEVITARRQLIDPQASVKPRKV